jgi:hypothetical protein
LVQLKKLGSSAPPVDQIRLKATRPHLRFSPTEKIVAVRTFG